MSNTQKPTALSLADKYEIEGFLGDHRFAQDHCCRLAATELRSLHARYAELEKDATEMMDFLAGCHPDAETILPPPEEYRNRDSGMEP